MSQAFSILEQFHKNLKPRRKQLKYWESRIGSPSWQRPEIMSVNVDDKKKAISMLRKERIDAEGEDNYMETNSSEWEKIISLTE